MSKKGKYLVILGSSRSDGETKEVYQKVFKDIKHKYYDIAELDLNFFDYDYKNQDDDFLKIAEEMGEYENIILATPVYWYTMSAQMKIFIDRISDLITIRKDLGRKLKGKKLYLLSSYGATMPIAFEEPFRQTCIYMEMEYVGCLYYYTGKHGNIALHNEERIKNFIKLLKD